MYSNKITAVVLALAAAPLVSAHGKIAVVTGNLGGNGTALGIKGAVIPGSGPNYVTEPDTTVFWSKDINTDEDIGFVVRDQKPLSPFRAGEKIIVSLLLTKRPRRRRTAPATTS